MKHSFIIKSKLSHSNKNKTLAVKVIEKICDSNYYQALKKGTQVKMSYNETIR